MSNAITPVPGNTGANVEHGAAFTPDSTSRELETEFLRALLALPARRVLTVLDGLEPNDIHHPHHRLILDAVARCARKQINDREGNQPVPPTAVQLDLTRAGTLDHPDVRAVLLDVTAGVNPVPDCWVTDLAAELRLHRLRRALTTVGESLISAAHGGTDELTRTLAHLPALLGLARRAGINLEEAQR